MVLRERRSRDRGWYDQMARCFALRSRDELVHRQRSRLRPGNQGHVRAWPSRGAPLSTADGPRQPGPRLAELPLIIERRTDIDGVEADPASSCRSQYRTERGADGAWRITRTTSIYEQDAITPALPGTGLDIDDRELTACRRSYRCLAGT